MTTRELLSENIQSAELRETAAFGDLRKRAADKIVLFGAGQLGRKTAAALRRQGIEPLGFADSDARLDGTLVDGIPVYSLSKAAERLRNDALFMVTTFLPSGGGVQARLLELERLGCRDATSFLPFSWSQDGILPHFGVELPSRLLRNAKQLFLVDEIFCDDLSRDTFHQELAWRLRADFSDAGPPAGNQYFPPDVVSPNPRESFVDGGAYDGDTIRAAPWKFLRVLAIEPDPLNAARLRTLADSHVEIREVLLGEGRGLARFNSSGTMASSRSDSGSLEVPITTLDELLAGDHPTFIKLDIEGDELAALRGGRLTLEKSQPVVAVCAYHRPEDLWTIPLFLREVLPAHRIYLRSHAWNGFELVVYAVPQERVPTPP